MVRKNPGSFQRAEGPRKPREGSLTAVVYLYPGLAELGALAELLAGVDVRVLGPLERLLQLVQLVGREGGAGPPLLPLERDPGLSLRVRTLLGTLGFD